MALKYLDPGGSATGGVELLGTVTGAVTAQTSVNNGQAYAYQFTTSSPAANANIRKAAVVTSAGGRLSVFERFPALPATNTSVILIACNVASGAGVLGVYLGSDGKLRLYTSGTTTLLKTGASVLSGSSTWHRIGLSFSITTTTDWSAKVYLDGVLEFTATNADGTLSSASPVDLTMGLALAAGTNYLLYASDIYIDDTADQTDPAAGVGDGTLHVRAVLPTTTASGGWDTTTGTGAVNERPINTANRINEAATGPATIVYNVEAASGGDADLTGATILGRMAWAWVTLSTKTGTPTGKLQIDGTESATAWDCLGTAETYELTTYVDSVTTYPTSVGITSSGIAADSRLAEIGVIVAYIPPAPSTTKAPPPFQRPWRRLQRRLIA